MKANLEQEKHDKEKQHFLRHFADSQNWITSEVRVPWVGFFEEHGRKGRLRFANLQFEQGGGITGSGSDDFGNFILDGQVLGEQTVRFIKQYTVKNLVEYSGNLRDTEITGNWYRTGTKFSGTYYLKMATPERWQGVKFKNNSSPQNVEFSMWVNKKGVYGLGKDDIGHFVLKGILAGIEVKFVQSYFFHPDVHFLGKISEEEGARIISGKFGLDDIEGEFFLVSGGQKELEKAGADIIMKTMKNIVDGGPATSYSKSKISQTRINGYTGPLTDREYYSTIYDNKWYIHPGRCRWDHITQNGQNSLKSHVNHLNLPTRDYRRKRSKSPQVTGDDPLFDARTNISMLPYLSQKHKEEVKIADSSDFLNRSEVLSTTGRRFSKITDSKKNKPSPSPIGLISQPYAKPYLDKYLNQNQPVATINPQLSTKENYTAPPLVIRSMRPSYISRSIYQENIPVDYYFSSYSLSNQNYKESEPSFQYSHPSSVDFRYPHPL